MHGLNQKGIIQPTLLLIILAIVGILVFVFISSTFPLQNKLLSQLYPKPQSQAQGPVKTFAAKLNLLPNPAPCCGSTVNASGFGYYSQSAVYINIHTPNSLYIYTRATDSSGNLSFVFSSVEAGNYVVKVYQNDPKNNKQTQMSETTLTVVQ